MHAYSILVIFWPQIQVEAERLAANVPKQISFVDCPGRKHLGYNRVASQEVWVLPTAVADQGGSVTISPLLDHKEIANDISLGKSAPDCCINVRQI